MYMSEKLYSSELNPTEKLALAYILSGHYRFKYISLDTMSKKLYLSEPSCSKVLKSLEKRDLIRWVKVEGGKYKIIVVCQKAFNKYAFLDKGESINENRKLTRDPVILSLGEIEAQKPLMTFDKKEIKKVYNNDNKRKEVVPSWYDEYKSGNNNIKQTTEKEAEDVKELIKTMF